MDIASHWHNFSLQIGITIFFTYVLIDGMYAYYTLAITRKKPFASASVGAVMHFLIAFGVLSYVQNYLYIIPLALGSWVGTYLVVKYDVHPEV